MDFEFKQFSLNHHRSTLKVGTDAVLLGAWTDIAPQTQNILDIGCGCGIIAMMLAQKSNCRIVGIDIHQPSVEEAQENARLSDFAHQLDFKNISLKDFVLSSTEQFDLIVSNPPFFDHALLSPIEQRNLSKHTQALSFEDLVLSVCKLLTNTGKFAVILPDSSVENFENICFRNGLFCQKLCRIYPKPNKNANRAMLLFSREKINKVVDSVIIRTIDNEYTQAYKNLTKEFYLKF